MKHNPGRWNGLKIGLIIWICVLWMSLPVAFAQPKLTDDDPDIPWKIAADELSFDDAAQQYIAKGNVTISKQDRSLTADFIRFDNQTMKAFAKGHVTLSAGEDVLSGESMEVDMEAQTGTIENGTLFLKEGNFHIRGNRIEKIGKATYTIRDGQVTTCDGDNPDWKITAKSLRVTVDGYGYATHAALWAKRVPLAYVPSMAFPVKQERQSGLLIPELGISDRKGFEFLQPFYWAINEQSDASFYAHYLANRGFKMGAEYRYLIDQGSKGTAMFDFLDDRKIDDGLGNNSQDYGYTDDNVLRTNSDRYWFRMKHNQALPAGFNAQVDLDVVSDQDYLQEFRDGLTGFDDTRDYFQKEFGRALDDFDDTTRVNRLRISKSWNNFYLNAEGRYYDNVIVRRSGDPDTTLHKLPEIDFTASKQTILDSSVYYTLNSEYVNYYREEGSAGNRLDIYPRLYFPYSVGYYFFVEPSVGLRGTLWSLYENQFSGVEDNTNRFIPDFKVDLNSEVFRVYNVNWGRVFKLKHSMRPEVTYGYTPDQDQSDLPFFDGIDRIASNHTVTYALINKLHAKKRISDTADEDEGQVYQALWFKLWQSYDIDEAQDEGDEPFSEVAAELNLYTSEFLRFQGDVRWDVYDSEINEHNLGLQLRDSRQDRFFVEYRNRRNQTETVYTNLDLVLTDSFSGFFLYERNLRTDKDIRLGGGLTFQRQCWAVNFGYLDEDDDQRFTIVVRLTGLGEVGTNLGADEIGLGSF